MEQPPDERRQRVQIQIEYWVKQVMLAEIALNYATEQLEIWSDR